MTERKEIEPGIGPQSLHLRPLTEEDIPDVIDIHIKAFGARSGRRFLEKAYYPMILDVKSSGFGFVQTCKGKVLGFIVGALDSSSWHKTLARKRRLECMIAGIRLCFAGWAALRETIRPMRYLYASSMNKPGGWIFFEAVDEAYRGQGMARNLLKVSLNHCRSKGLSRCWIRTLKTNKPMNRFLTQFGFRIHRKLSEFEKSRCVYFYDFGNPQR